MKNMHALSALAMLAALPTAPVRAVQNVRRYVRPMKLRSPANLRAFSELERHMRRMAELNP